MFNGNHVVYPEAVFDVHHRSLGMAPPMARAGQLAFTVTLRIGPVFYTSPLTASNALGERKKHRLIPVCAGHVAMPRAIQREIKKTMFY